MTTKATSSRGGLDRVNEVYFGRALAPGTQEVCRRRIDWMVRQAAGRRVLDVGCSQGIASILLARRGYEVWGVDIEPQQIEYAQREASQERAEVRSRLHFVCADARRLEFADGFFDSVLLGEVLEHLSDPERLLEETWRVLGAQGRLIVTVPFGLHPYPDHRQTFFLSNLMGLLGQFVEVETVEIYRGYILAAGRRRPERRKPFTLEGMSCQEVSAFLRASEEAFLAWQRQLLELAERRKSVLQKRGRQIEHLRAELGRERADRQQLAARLQGTLAALAEQQHEATNLRNEVTDLQVRLDEISAERDALRQQVEALTGSLENAEQKRRAHYQRLRRLRARLAQIEQSRRYRFAEALAEAVREPARGILRLPIVVFGLFREAIEEWFAGRRALPKRLDADVGEIPPAVSVAAGGRTARRGGPNARARAAAALAALRDAAARGETDRRRLATLIGRAAALAPHSTASLCTEQALRLESTDPGQALFWVEQAVGKHSNLTRLRLAARIAKTYGMLSRALAYLQEIHRQTGRQSDAEGVSMLAGQLAVLRGHWHPPLLPARPGYQPRPDRVVLCLHNCLPETHNGYAIRSQYVLRTLVDHGVDAIGVTRLGFPDDLTRRVLHNGRREITVDGVPYVHMLRAGTCYTRSPLDQYLNEYTKALFEEVQRLRPAVLHASSNFVNGLAAHAVARRLGIPYIYEARGFWEVTRASRYPGYENNERYLLDARMETEAARTADAVVTISEGLCDVLRERGVPADRIVVVPNGVDTERFVPTPPDTELARRLGIDGRRVIGYIGSVVDYEGLDTLLEAAAILRERGLPFAVLIVGGGPVLDDLRVQARALGLEGYVLFPGRVPHDEVLRYYSLIDICPFPRRGLPVCEIVTPLKPYESMAMGKAVLVSDVRALREMVIHEQTGLVFRREDARALADALGRLVEDADLCRELGARSRQWVCENRSWQRLGRKYLELYERLGVRVPAPLPMTG